MAFVKFTNTRSRLDTPKVSIWSRGQIGFNQSAIIKYDMKSFKYAVMYFDADSRKIGIELTNDSTAEGAIKMLFRKTGGASFSAVAFLKTFDIVYSVTKKYNLVFNNKSGLYIIDLKEGE